MKKFRREISGFERPEKRSWNEDVGEKYGVSSCESSSIEITNILNTLQSLGLFHEVGNDMLELLQRVTQ